MINKKGRAKKRRRRREHYGYIVKEEISKERKLIVEPHDGHSRGSDDFQAGNHLEHYYYYQSND